jgi:asparagine synthase (glutamine-hydrolysing)
MSAILGVYHLDGRQSVGVELKRMVDTLAHRGPDGSGVWMEGSVGLGHRMLWTTPESVNERLPAVNKSGEFAITADARLDNRDELISLLRLTDLPSLKISDSQLILASYQEWGDSCPEKLLGDFAFAIWDSRKQQLFCARDHFGVKPLYYYLSDKIFAFATEIKALLCLPAVPCHLNEVKVADYLAEAQEDKRITFYQDIFRLPPAHRLVVSRNGGRLCPYWSLDPSKELQLNSDEEYAEKFRELFSEAVRCRLRSHLPVGSMLSGGLDSSSITCMARKHLVEGGSNRLHTFSAIFSEISKCDERSFILPVLAQGDLQPHFVNGDELGPLTDVDRILWHEDEALYGPTLFIHWGLYNAVQKHGVRVLLDGFDGDSTLSHGFLYLDELAREGRWLTLFVEAKGLANYFNASPWRLLKAYAWRYGLDPAFSRYQPLKQVRRGWRALRKRMLRGNPGEQRPAWRAILNPNFAQRINVSGRRKVWWQAQPGAAQTEREGHYKTLMQGIQPLALEVLDKAAAAFSVDARYPFWDKRLVEFCLSLPAKQKLHRGWSRVVMRRAMSNILPREVQWRNSKVDFMPIFLRGLLSLQRERLDRVVWGDAKEVAAYVDTTVLRDTYHKLISRSSRNQESDVLTVWRAASLALWLANASPFQHVRKEVIPM